MNKPTSRQPPSAKPAPKSGNGSNEVISASWSGPLPPPSTLADFEHIIPGSAERILGMAEREQAHRIGFDKAEQSAAIREYGIGQWLGWITVMACIAGAGYTAYIQAHALVSVAFLGVPVAAVAKQFLTRRRTR